MSERPDNEDGGEAKEVLQKLHMFCGCLPDSRTVAKYKDAVINSGLKIGELVDLQCHRDPPWSLAVLETHAPYLQVLDLYGVRLEHLQAAMRMPQLRELSVHSFDGEDPFIADPSTLRPSETVLSGLQKLVTWKLSWPTVVALVTANRFTLRELELEMPYGWTKEFPDLQLDLATPFPMTLPHLRKLQLSFPSYHDLQSAEEIKARAFLDERFSDVLIASRLSLEELELYGARWKHLELLYDLPKLREVRFISIHDDLIDHIHQVDLVNGLEIPVRRDGEENIGLRKYYSEHSAHQVTQLVLFAHRNTLEEVHIVIFLSAENLETIQRMPRLRTLRLRNIHGLEDPSDLVEVEAECVGLRSLTTEYVPNEAVLFLLSRYAQSLEEVNLLDVTREQLLAVYRLPKLRTLHLYFFSDRIYTQCSVAQGVAMRLKRLEAAAAPVEVLRSLLIASRDTLQEAKISSEVSLGMLLELQRMPALRTLDIYVDRFSYDGLDPELSSLLKKLPERAGGLQRFHLFGAEVPSPMVSHLLMSHSRTLVDVGLHVASREHLLVTLRMPALRRLHVETVRGNLREATCFHDVAVEEGGVQWMRLGYSDSPLIPLEVTRWLLTAHRHSLRYLELLFWNEKMRAGDLWPYSFRNLHRVLQQCGLERLETLVLHRFCRGALSDNALCRKQVAAINRALPGTLVRCYICDYVGKSTPN